MKTSILKAVLWGTLALPALTACEMDQFPTDSIPNEESWQVYQDAVNFNQGLYRYLQSVSSVGWYMSDIQMDYFQPGKGYGNRMGMTYRWEFLATEDDMESVWSTAYSAITNANNFINNYRSIITPETSEDEATALEQFAGEAYFIRAYAYYVLATRFCKDYNAATAQTDLGLPIMETVDINARPARSTMQETWDFIKGDLDKADSLITETDPTGTHISLPVVDAMRARVALQMDNYSDAVNYAKQLVENDYFALASDSASFANLWINDEGDEIIFEPAEDNQVRHTWGGFFQYNVSQSAFSPDWIPSQTTYDMYEDGDLRKSQWFMQADKVIESDVESTAGIMLFAKYPGNPALLKAGESTLTTRANAPKMIRVAEMYLILAEAYAQQGDNENARKYLNDLLSSRGASEVEASGNILAAVKQEWKKEFIGEGMRMTCLKRWGEGFRRNPAAQDESLIVMTTPELGVAANIAASNMRWVWEIPQNDLTTNKNLVPNWQ
ncbi:RagB/SusD family nutrient uptake outer membrane protein [Pseudoprevotella muciniphila]|nr:RagB/SusD family nutrient uptake outer membrane protein [Pseudoprevotella muciniphila]